MSTAKLTINFDLTKDRDKRIYHGITNLPFYLDVELSEAFIIFFESMIRALQKCEDPKQHCEKLLLQLSGRKVLIKELDL
jgi:hypothetical protein